MLLLPGAQGLLGACTAPVSSIPRGTSVCTVHHPSALGHFWLDVHLKGSTQVAACSCGGPALPACPHPAAFPAPYPPDTAHDGDGAQRRVQHGHVPLRLLLGAAGEHAVRLGCFARAAAAWQCCMWPLLPLLLLLAMLQAVAPAAATAWQCWHRGCCCCCCHCTAAARCGCWAQPAPLLPLPAAQRPTYLVLASASQVVGPVCWHGGGGHRGPVARRERVPLCGDEVRLLKGWLWHWLHLADAACCCCRLRLLETIRHCSPTLTTSPPRLNCPQPLGGQQLPHAQPGDMRAGERGGGAHGGELRGDRCWLGCRTPQSAHAPSEVKPR